MFRFYFTLNSQNKTGIASYVPFFKKNRVIYSMGENQQVAGEAIFEIGRRLKHVKENDLAHGEFGKWLKTVNMTPRTAQRFIKIVDELGSKATTLSHLGWSALNEIATLPPDQRDVPHELPSGETKKPDEMTVRELRELKRQLKAERAELGRLGKICLNKHVT